MEQESGSIIMTGVRAFSAHLLSLDFSITITMLFGSSPTIAFQVKNGVSYFLY